jgi:hypothetical protein
MNTAKMLVSRLPRNGRQHYPSEQQRPALADVFRARAEARVLLYAAGELDLHEAVDALQAAAIASGLVDQIGQDRAQQIMSDVFRAVRS